MVTPEIEELLKDARMIIDYAARAGRLPDNSLSTAVAAVEQASATDVPPETASLVTALNIAARAITPMTLIELRAGRSPFNAKNQKIIRILQIFLSVFTIVLTGLVAYYTQLLHQEETAVRALQVIQDAKPLDKLNTARKMAQIEGVLEKHDSQYDYYHQAVSQLRDLQEKISGAYQLANAVAVRAAWPFRRQIESSYPTISTQSQPSGTVEAGTIVPVKPAISAPMAPAQNVHSDDLVAPRIACDRIPSAASLSSNAPVELDWLCGVLTDMKGEFEFSTTLGIGLNSYNLLPTSYLTYELQADMAALNGWILPLLYGLLGSSVFLMRNILDTRTPNTQFFPSVLRIALGGIAGIVIGWFYVPAPSKGSELAAITSAPFALAFLAGFSIDILFSVLDRLNRAISDEPKRGNRFDLSAKTLSPSSAGLPRTE